MKTAEMCNWSEAARMDAYDYPGYCSCTLSSAVAAAVLEAMATAWALNFRCLSSSLQTVVDLVQMVWPD